MTIVFDFITENLKVITFGCFYVIYKFQHFIFRKEIEDKGEYVCKTKSLSEAEYKIKKHIQGEYRNNEGVNVERFEEYKKDENPIYGKYVVTEIIVFVTTMLYKVIFVPIKVTKEEYDEYE